MSSPPEIGSSASSYQILARLAVGGMAEIFLARAATGAGVARFVVLKRVLRERARDFEFLRMFLDEARLAAQLQHPNIAQVYDVGKLGDSYFFTMEYVHGVTVRELTIKLAGAPMPIACVLAIAQGAASGLHHAHERIGVDGKPLNIVHRDVSPSNLLVSFEGHVKVVDFGVAKAASREHETQSGTVRGKISYLSPEQASGEKVDRRSDVFSLGIVLWELLTGKRLFKRGSDFASMAAIIDDPTAPPSTLRADIPPALDALVLRALAKNRQDRFQTAQELVDAIEVVATETGSAISTATLSRLTRELFGSRPEPWIALQGPDDGGAFTVTAEPVPKVLVIPPANDIDRRLAAVTDLSSTVAPEDARPTVRVMLVDRDATATPSTDPRAVRQPRAASPAPSATSPAQSPASAPSSAPSAPSRRPSAPSLPPARAATAATVLDARATSIPSLVSPPAAQRSQLPFIIGGGAFLLALSLGIAAAIGLSSDRRNPDTPVVTIAEPAADAAIAVDADLVADAAAPQPTIVVDAAAPQPTIVVDAAAPQPMNAESPVEERVLDAGSQPRVRPSRPTARDVFAACVRGTAAKAPTECTLVACRLEQSAKAIAWFATVPAAKRATVSAKCRAAGVKVEPTRPREDPRCEIDPSRCQF